MKRIFSILLVILFLPLCACDGISDILFSGSSGGDAVTIEPFSVEIYNGELSAYNKLDPDQQKVYSIMLYAIENMQLDVIDITDHVSGNGFSDAVIAHRALLCDRPDIFWIPKKYSVLSYEGSNDKHICFKDYFAEDDGIGYYGVTKEQKDQMQSELDAVVNRVLDGAQGLSSDFEKELYFHDYICDNVTYDSEAANNLSDVTSHAISAYGALVEGSAICEGYAKAMQLLCMKSGIPCTVIYGSHDNVPHMWNLINPGDGLYYLDTTFDDGSSTATLHSYFNVTKEELLETHVFDSGYIPGNEYDSSDEFNFFDDDCKNTALNFYEKTNAYITDDCTEAEIAVLKAYSDGKNSLELQNRTSLSLKDAFIRLQQKTQGKLNMERFYGYESENILIATW